MNDEAQRQQARPDGTRFPLVRLGSVEGVMDAILTGEDAVWVSLADGMKPEDVVGLEVFVRPRDPR